ncbi:MAG: type II toxin-antitoxin system prevent-host-death family antitoxin [Arhodomonas sp.]|nr:type II toxin-antitoxin system prevent-host-death family antitoxin [Arhodomonas sp.]
MSESTISLASAKARLRELAERAASGESILITKRGKVVVRLCSAHPPKKPIDARSLQAITDAQGYASDQDFMRTVRDDARY